jgi:hypothetical protein
MAEVYPVASGLTSHSGTYTPEIWAAMTLVKFYDYTVFGEIANTDYEGEIKDRGDTVHIRTIPDITINDYVIGQKLNTERPIPGVVDLLIDKGKYYNFSVNDVELKQSDLAYIQKWTADAAEQLAIKIDIDILADIYSDAHASNSGNTAGRKSSGYALGATGSPVVVDKTEILDYVVDMGSVLDEQSVPQSGRYLVLPAIFCGMIKKSDLKDASLTGDAVSPLRNGKIGMLDRFTVYNSNNIDTTTDGANTVQNCIFGQMTALTFATQLVKNETLKNQDDFGDLLRGLQVFGYKVIKPEALGHFYAVKG